MIKEILILMIIFSTIVSAEVKINEFLPNPIDADNAPMPEGEWVELYNSGSEDIDLEGYSLYDDIGVEPDIVIADTNTYSTVIKANDYLVVYMNGRSRFLNNDGFEKIKLTDLNDSLVDEVSYSNSKEGISWSLVDNIWQYGLATPDGENKGNKSIENSKIKIKKIYNEKNKWGDTIRVKFDVFKADTRKNSIKAWVENGKKVSEETKMNIYGKYSDYNLILPIKIKDNCDGKFEDGKYDLIVSGFDDDDSEEIKIEGNNCFEVKEKKEVVVEKIKEVKKEPKSEKVIYSRKGIIYESSQDKIRRAGVFFMTGTIVLLLLYHVWKK